MLKKLIVMTAFFLATNAMAIDNLTINQLANDKDTKATFSQMVKSSHLPSWILNGGTESPSETVTIGENQYQVITACKPHSCSSEQIAVIFSKENKVMSGVFSKVIEKQNSQKLVWLNINDDLSIDGKTILFAALSGSLANHPNTFNFK